MWPRRRRPSASTPRRPCPLARYHRPALPAPTRPQALLLNVTETTYYCSQPGAQGEGAEGGSGSGSARDGAVRAQLGRLPAELRGLLLAMADRWSDEGEGEGEEWGVAGAAAGEGQGEGDVGAEGGGGCQAVPP